MRFLANLGKITRSVGRTLGTIGTGVKTIANSGVTRTIANVVGTAGRTLLPLAVSAVPELAGVSGVANKVFKGLQNGSVLNRVANVGGVASAVGNQVYKVGEGLK